MSRLLLLLSIAIAQMVSASAQTGVALISERMNIVYRGYANPVRIQAGSIPCESLWLSCNKGTFRRLNDCRFEFRPDSVETVDLFKDDAFGKAMVVVSRMKKRDTIHIDSVMLRISDVPRPTARIAWKSYGSIKADMLKKQTGISGFYDCSEGPSYPITGFAMTLLRRAGTWSELFVTGPLFSLAMRSLLQMAEAGDRVLISEIKARDNIGVEMELQAIALTVE